MLKKPVIYPEAVIKTSKMQPEAFLDQLQTDEAQTVFEKTGFAISGK